MEDLFEDGPMEFSDITQNPLLQPVKIDGVLAAIPQKKSSYWFTKRMPMIEVKKDRVEYDMVADLSGGMTPMVAPNSSTPVFSEFTLAQQSWEPAEFREKTQLTEAHIRQLRKIGNLQEYERAEKLISLFKGRLMERLANVLEWQRRQAVFSQTIDVIKVDGNLQSIPMPKPAYLRPTALTSWDDPTAEPTQDVQIWVSDFNELSAYRVQDAIMPHRSYEKLTGNDNLQSIRENNYAVFDGTQSAVASILSRYLGDAVSLSMNNDSIKMNVKLVADSNAGTNTITVDRASMLYIGAKIYLRQLNQNGLGNIERVEVQSFTENADGSTTITLTANLLNDFKRKDSAVWQLFLIPEDRMLISGMLESDVETHEGLVSAEMLNIPVTFMSTQSNFENLLAEPQTGIWGFALKPKQDPPREEYLVGVRGLPAIHYATAWSTPTIFF